MTLRPRTPLITATLLLLSFPQTALAQEEEINPFCYEAPPVTDALAAAIEPPSTARPDWITRQVSANLRGTMAEFRNTLRYRAVLAAEDCSCDVLNPPWSAVRDETLAFFEPLGVVDVESVTREQEDDLYRVRLALRDERSGLQQQVRALCGDTR